MDWAKVDAPLASALAGASGDDSLSVFVQIDHGRGDVDRAVLDRLGLQAGELSTATLSPAQVDALTDEDWVLSVRLAGRLRLLREPAPAASLAPAGDKKAGAGDKDRRPKQDKRKRRPT